MAALLQTASPAAQGAAMKESTTFGDRSITTEWASLPPELVQAIADCGLSTSGIATYMDMRAVCPSWRSAIPKPSPTEAVVDPRFRPRQWVMLQWESKDDRVIFLNASTGRFRSLHLHVIRDYVLVDDSDGLLVLADRERPHAACLLNPLTGDMLQFAAPIPRVDWVLTAITGSEPTLMFFFCTLGGRHSRIYDDIPTYYSLQQNGDAAVYCADPTSQLRAMKFHDEGEASFYFYLENVVIYAGHVYVLNVEATIFKIVRVGGHWYMEPIIETHMKDSRIYLVESAGKLLLVKEGPQSVEVFGVDVERKRFEPVDNIGSHALFLRCHKCVSVDTDKLPSINGNCIYSAFAGFKRFAYEDRYDVLLEGMYVRHDLSDGKKEYISSAQVTEYDGDDDIDIIDEGPFSLAQVLLTPYPKVKAQLDRNPPN